MINISRKLPPPASLASRRYDGVKEILLEMFYHKCYLCEQKNPVSTEIEHLKPKSGYPDLEFVWSNLFIACHHCNTIKNYISDSAKTELNLINITDFTTIVTDEIKFNCKAIPKEILSFEPISDQAESSVIDTMLLLDNIYNSKSESKKFDAKKLTDLVNIEVKKLLDLIFEYEFGSFSENRKTEIKSQIRNCLSIEAPFTAFKIWYVKNNESLAEFLPLIPSFNNNNN